MIGLELEIEAFTFIYQDEAEVVSCGVFFVHFTECGRQVEAAEEQSDGDGFALITLITFAIQWLRTPRHRFKWAYLLMVSHP
jgi:citrate lyase synthetase